MSSERVLLHVYDLSNGMVKNFTHLLGKEFEGIWHTGIVVYGREYFFGGGIFNDVAGQTHYGTPTKIIELGTTQVTKEVFEEFLNQIRPRFRMQDYHLINNNCNNFTDTCSNFLVGHGIPRDIIDLPAEMLATPMGQMIRPMLEQRQQQMNQFYQENGGQANPLAGLTGGALPNNNYNNPQHPPAQQQHQRSTSRITTALSVAPEGKCLVVFGNLNQADRVVAKFKEFVYTSFVELSDDERDAVTNCGALIDLLNENVNAVVKPEQCKLVHHLVNVSLRLSEEQRFPALDMIRLFLLNSGIVESFNSVEAIANLRLLLSQVEKVASSRRMALRAIANLLSHDAGRRIAMFDAPTSDLKSAADGGFAFKCACKWLGDADEQVCVAAASIAYNFCFLMKGIGVPLGIELDEDALTRVALGVVATLQHSEPNHKSVPILMQALLLLLKKNVTMRQLTLNLEFDVAPLLAAFPNECAEVQRLLQEKH